MRITTNATATAAIIDAGSIESVSFSPDQLVVLGRLLDRHVNAEPFQTAQAVRHLQAFLRNLATERTEIAIVFSE